MVEGDLMDLTLPTLLQALSQEQSTTELRVQQGSVQGALYLCDGALVHATGTRAEGDEALLELLGWTAGRFRIVRDTESRPRTVSPRLTELITGHGQAARSAAPSLAGSGGLTTDEQLLQDALALLTRLDLDSTKVSETLQDTTGVSTVSVLATTINSLVGFVVARTSDLNVLPSRVLSRLGDSNPHSQVITEVDERVSLDMVAEILRTWEGDPASRQQFFVGMCDALIEVMGIYGRTLGTFFRSERERQEWRSTFDLYVQGLTTVLGIECYEQGSAA
jgi:hypothetical protein